MIDAVMFSPLPPSKSGIADYTAELIPALAKVMNLTVVTATEFNDADNFAAQFVTAAEYAEASDLHGLPTFYQIGNNKDHVFVYEAFRRNPGILVQHDFNLHFLVEDATLGRGDPAGYSQVLESEYGGAGRKLAELRQFGVYADGQKMLLPLNTHLLHEAKGIIVHSQWVRDRLPKSVSSPVTVLAHHYAPQADGYRNADRKAMREKLGLDADRPVVLSLGYITPPKQIQSTLRALKQVRERGHDFTFVIGGARNPGLDIDKHIADLDLGDCVVVTGFLEEENFFEYIVAADMLVNLRYPSVGESSGTLARALALGLPAIIYDFGPFAEMPDDCVIKVPLELGQPTQLAAAIVNLLEDQDQHGRLSHAAMRHMTSKCSVGQSAQAYLDCAMRAYDMVPRR